MTFPAPVADRGPHRANLAEHRPASRPPTGQSDAESGAAARARQGRPVFRLWPTPIDWGQVTKRERDAYEIGFMNGFFLREDEVAQANADADRLYRIAFDRQHPRRRW